MDHPAALHLDPHGWPNLWFFGVTTKPANVSVIHASGGAPSSFQGACIVLSYGFAVVAVSVAGVPPAMLNPRTCLFGTSCMWLDTGGFHHVLLQLLQILHAPSVRACSWLIPCPHPTHPFVLEVPGICIRFLWPQRLAGGVGKLPVQ